MGHLKIYSPEIKKVKVNINLGQAMKTQSIRRGIALLFL
jgi:hypothetical protein